MKTTLDTGTHKIQVAETPPPTPLIPIVITNINGALTPANQITAVDCYELTNITVTGTLAIPDDTFKLPVRREDGRIYYFLATVTGGAFSVTLNFPVSGSFRYSIVEANRTYDTDIFSVDTMVFDVLIKIN